MLSSSALGGTEVRLWREHSGIGKPGLGTAKPRALLNWGCCAGAGVCSGSVSMGPSPLHGAPAPFAACAITERRQANGRPRPASRGPAMAMRHGELCQLPSAQRPGGTAVWKAQCRSLWLRERAGCCFCKAQAARWFMQLWHVPLGVVVCTAGCVVYIDCHARSSGNVSAQAHSFTCQRPGIHSLTNAYPGAGSTGQGSGQGRHGTRGVIKMHQTCMED